MDSTTIDLELKQDGQWVEIPLNEAGVSTRSLLQVENVSCDDVLYRLGSASTSRGHTFNAGLFLRVDQTLFVKVPDDLEVTSRGVTLVITRSN